MKSQLVKCPSCGANIKQPDVTEKAISCDYCHATILLSDLQQNAHPTTENQQYGSSLFQPQPESAFKLKHILIASIIFVLALFAVTRYYSSKAISPRPQKQGLAEVVINYEIDKIQEQGLGVTAKKVSGSLGKIKAKLLPSKQKPLTIAQKKEIYAKLVSTGIRSTPEADLIRTLCKEYDIPEKQLKAISKEGKKEGWPTE